MLGVTRGDEYRLLSTELEILWQRRHEGVWWAILGTNQRVRLVEPYEVGRQPSPTGAELAAASTGSPATGEALM